MHPYIADDDDDDDDDDDHDVYIYVYGIRSIVVDFLFFLLTLVYFFNYFFNCIY
jgi:hypothetical protein